MSSHIRYVYGRDSAPPGERVGAKAATLSRLSLAFPVPDFFVIVAEAFVDGAMIAAARAQAAVALAALGNGPFAVRSSAREEDGALHAHAGQYETELGVRSEDVFAAAGRVWRSGFSESLARYRTVRGLNAAPRPPAVIVQRMIEPSAAGIAFSACPLTGDRTIVSISATEGRADALAAGEVDGDAYRIVADDVIVDAVGDARVLSDDECRAVAHLARACAAHFGAPQDIEWAFGRGRLLLLQSRPITTFRDSHSVAPSACESRTPCSINSSLRPSPPGPRRLKRLPAPLRDGAGGGGKTQARDGLLRTCRGDTMRHVDVAALPRSADGIDVQRLPVDARVAPPPPAPPRKGAGSVFHAPFAGPTARQEMYERPFTDPVDERTIWDNSNIVESYPGVVAPLTYSFARHVYTHVYRAFSRLMGVSLRRIEAHGEVFDNLLGRLDGRVYYNLVNWHRALALFPGFKSNRAFMEQMMGVAEPLPAELAEAVAPHASNVFVRMLDLAQLVRVGAGLLVHAIMLGQTSARFRKRLNRALATQDSAIDAASAPALAREYRRLEKLLLTRWDAPLINDFLCMIAFGASRKALERWAGGEGLALHGDVMIGQGDIVSAEPARFIRAMGMLARRAPGVPARLAAGDRSALADAPGLEAAFGAYLGKFGDRCVQELKLESVSLHEDPTSLLLAIAAAARSTEATVGATLVVALEPNARANRATTRVAPTMGRAVRSAEARKSLRMLFNGRPLKYALAAWLLAQAKARVRDRENLRFERTRLFGRVRRIFGALGRRLAESGALDHPRDIFHLTVEEALGAAESDASIGLRDLAAQRRAEDAASTARPDPPERIDSAHPASPSAPAQRDDIRTGLACCAGTVVARVRVIDDPRVELPSPGEILVARATDPGWIAAFANAAGIIAERGSLLSHSAIVAREMGVPCVVGLKGATQWLHSGDLVRLDGAAGSVELLAR